MGDLAAATNNQSSLLDMASLLDAVDGSFIGDGFDSSSFCFTSVVTDSRNVVKGSLFVPLIGTMQDGHKYIPSALEKGASVVFVQKCAFKSDPETFENYSIQNPAVAFILVKDCMKALQDAARAYVEKFPDLIRISVTGSSGKTTTKEILASIMKQKYNIVCNKGNLNSETGLPLSCFEIRPEHQMAILEMGMNRKNEIKEIASVFKPQHAIITNIGRAHIGILKTRKNIAREKKNVFNYIKKDGFAVIPYADDFVKFLGRGVKGKKIYYGFDCLGDEVKLLEDRGIFGTDFEVCGKKMNIALPGKYNFLNALSCVKLALALGVDADSIKKGVEEVKALGGRSHIIKGYYTILEDCYNANPDSMEKVLELSSGLTGFKNKIFVLGSMLELGTLSEEAHKKAGQLALQGGANLIAFVGKDMRAGYDEALKLSCGNKNLRLEYFENHDDESIKHIADLVKGFAGEGDLILLKGSNGIGLSRLVPLLDKEGSGV